MQPERDEILSFLPFDPAYRTKYGAMCHGDALHYLRALPDESIDLVLTSPPFALVRKKQYGNTNADEYVLWFFKFAVEVQRVLKSTGSFVIDIGGSWLSGAPVRSTYHYQLLIELTRPGFFHLAQDFFWYSPSKLPSPAEWVTVRKVRVKDAINPIWWLSKTPYPKAGNQRVRVDYSDAMKDLLRNGYTAKKRPSGHEISTKFGNDRGGAIPSNLLVVSNTSSNDYYQRRCREANLDAHPARFPPDIPLFFVEMLTDPDDIVLDIFAGSNVTGWVCEHVHRNWLAFELDESYVKGSEFRFESACPPPPTGVVGSRNPQPLRSVRIVDGGQPLGTGEIVLNGRKKSKGIRRKTKSR